MFDCILFWYSQTTTLPFKKFPIIFFLVVICISSYGQSQGDSLFGKSVSKIADEQRGKTILDLPARILNAIDKKASSIEQKLDWQTEKYLSKLKRQENRLRKKLWKKDSTLAKELFDKTDEKYNSLRKLSGKLDNYQSLYSGHLDSLSTALNFLKNEDLKRFSSNPELQKALGECKGLQEKFNQSEQVRKYLSERKKSLKEQFEKLGMMRQFKKFEKQVYYYRAQLEEYKRMFEDPSKFEAKLMELVLKIPRFKNFFASNSLLASLFPNMGPVNSNSSQASFGLQTRAALNQYLNARFAGSVNFNQVIQQNFQSAQGQLEAFRNKMMSVGGGSFGNNGDFDIPGFKPNNQKTKSFLKRLEYGTNLQTAHGTSWFPITTDLGLSLGYQLNDKNIIGIGASYKIGWGKDIHHIDLSSQGAGFRSFADINIKKTFFLSGGFEYNYQKPFLSLQQLYFLNDWQQSGLVGLSKIVTLKTKFFKKTKIQLLWDFLSYQQRPQTQAFKFRVGYNF